MFFFITLAQASDLGETQLDWPGIDDGWDAYMGKSVTSGDYDDDGKTDIAVGAPLKNRHPAYDIGDGAVGFFWGEDGGRPSEGDPYTNEDYDYADLGWSLATGDFNGDGKDDIAMGYLYGDYNNNGSVELLYGGSRDWSSSEGLNDRVFRSETGDSFQAFAWALGAQDINGDGADELLVGVVEANELQDGAVDVFEGSEDGLIQPMIATLTADIESGYTKYEEYFGNDVDGAGDVDGDGYGDAIVGMPYSDCFDETPVMYSCGSIHLFRGSASGFTETEFGQMIWSPDPATVGQFGRSLSGAGDMNDDGFDDIAVGAPGGEASVYVYFGSADGIDEASGVRIRPDTAEPRAFGIDVDAGGDINGDDIPDVVVGTPTSDSYAESGEAYIILGGGTLGEPTDWSVRASDGHGDDGFGKAVAWAKDMDDDGKDEVVVGAPYHRPETDEADLYDYGSAYVFQTADWEADADTDADSDSDTDADSDADTDADTDTDTDADTDADADSDADTGTLSDTGTSDEGPETPDGSEQPSEGSAGCACSATVDGRNPSQAALPIILLVICLGIRRKNR